MKTSGHRYLTHTPLLLALTIFATAGAIKWQSNFMPEVAPAPMPALPSPNARDYFNAADSLMKDSEAIAWVTEKSMPAPSGATAAQLADLSSGYHTFTAADYDRLTRENLPAFGKLREGLKYPYAEATRRSFQSIFPDYSKDRALARALAVAAIDSEKHEDWGSSLNYDIDAIQLGADLSHGPTLISSLVGVACATIGRKNAQSVIEHLTARQAEAGAQRMVDVDNAQAPAYQAMASNEMFTQGSLLELFHSPRWRKEFSDGFSQNLDNRSPPVSAVLVRDLILSTESPRTAYDNYTNYMDRLVAIDKEPWPTQLAEPDPPTPKDPVNLILLPVFEQAKFRVFTSIASDRLLEVQLALRTYDASVRRYPDSLDQLVPAYLPSVPTDPFSNNQELKYRLAGKKYVLYSIGPDAVDNGGTPIYDPTRKFRPNFVWDDNEKGDIVAGINQ